MQTRAFGYASSPAAAEIGLEPVPPVPPDLDLDLDLDIDFDRLPEIEVPGESAPPPAPKSPSPRGPAEARAAEPAPRRMAWWPFLGATLALLFVALSAVPFALARLNGMSRDMTRLASRVAAAEAENATLTDRLAREAVEAVDAHLVDTERRIARIRCALDDVRRNQPSSTVEAPKTPQPVAKAQEKAPVAPTPKPVEFEKPAAPTPAPAEVRKPAPPAPVPLVGASKHDPVEPIAPASAVKAAPKPPKPVEKDSGRILLPTEIYGDDE